MEYVDWKNDATHFGHIFCKIIGIFLLILVLKRPSRSFGKVLYGVGCFGIWLMWDFDQLSIDAAGRLILDSRIIGVLRKVIFVLVLCQLKPGIRLGCFCVKNLRYIFIGRVGI